MASNMLHSRRDLFRLGLECAASTFLISLPFGLAAHARDLVPEGEERFFRDDTDPIAHLIEGLEFTLEQSMLPGRSVVIRGDIVRLGSVLMLPGHNISIFARRFVCGVGARIDTRGTIGSPNYIAQRAQDGGSFGAPGSDGAGGGPGIPGGAIQIVVGQLEGILELEASGGDGGGAQGGGNGAAGRDGEDWREGFERGGNGTPGGIAGIAGSPGRGGDGGTIKAIYQNITPQSDIRALSKGGAFGAKGVHGKSGIGGHAGAGTHHKSCHDYGAC
jgi:hypothetical protein